MSQGQIPGYPSGVPPPTSDPPQAAVYLSDSPQQASAIRAGSNPYINRAHEPITSTTQPAPSLWPQSPGANSTSQEQNASSSWPPPAQPPPPPPIQQSNGRKNSNKRVRVTEPSVAPTAWGATKYGTNKKRTNENGENGQIGSPNSSRACGFALKTCVMSMAILDLIVAIICCIVTIVRLMKLSSIDDDAFESNAFVSQYVNDRKLFLRTGLGTSVIIILSTIGLLIGAHSRTNVLAVSSFVISWIAFLVAIVVYCLVFLVRDPLDDAARWTSLIGMILALVYRIYESIVLNKFVNEPVPESEAHGVIDDDLHRDYGRGGRTYPGATTGTYPAQTYQAQAGTYAAGGYGPQTVTVVPPFGGYDYDPLYSSGGLGLGLGLGYGLGYGGLGYGGLGYGYGGYGGLGYGGYGYDPFDYHHHHHHGLWL